MHLRYNLTGANITEVVLTVFDDCSFELYRSFEQWLTDCSFELYRSFEQWLTVGSPTDFTTHFSYAHCDRIRRQISKSRHRKLVIVLVFIVSSYLSFQNE